MILSLVSKYFSTMKIKNEIEITAKEAIQVIIAIVVVLRLLFWIG